MSDRPTRPVVTWSVFSGDAGAIPAEHGVILPLDEWRERAGSWRSSGRLLGLALEAGDDPYLVAADLASFALISVRFPRFTDARGYALARVLRDRLGFEGELRAFGESLHGQAYFLRASGFDTFELRLPGSIVPSSRVFQLDDESVVRGNHVNLPANGRSDEPAWA